MKKIFKIVIILLLMLGSMIFTFEFTLRNLQIKEINEKENIVLMSILGQNWIYEK